MKKTLFLLVLAFFTVSAFSQGSGYVLKLTSKKNPGKVRYIYEGKRMAVLMPDGTKHKGKLEFANATEISLNGVVIPCDKIPVIKGQSTGLVLGKIFGGILMAGSLLFTGAGATVIIQGFAEHSLATVFLVPLGLVISAGGVGGTLMGTSILFFAGKKYDLENDWDMEIVTQSP